MYYKEIPTLFLSTFLLTLGESDQHTTPNFSFFFHFSKTMADFFIFEHQERQEKIFKERKFIEDVLDEELNNYRFSR